LVNGSFLNERGILRVLGNSDGDAVMTALETQSGSLVKRAVRMLKDNGSEGIDFGIQQVHDQIDSLVTASVITQSQGEALKEYGKKMISRSEQLGQGITKVGYVQQARA